MVWWRYLDDAGEVLGVSERFADQEEAEAWLGETWADLRDRGAAEVELVDEERRERLYRMALSEPS